MNMHEHLPRASGRIVRWRGEAQSSEFPRRREREKKESEWEGAGKDALADIKITEVGKKSTNNTLQCSGAESI